MLVLLLCRVFGREWGVVSRVFRVEPRVSCFRMGVYVLSRGGVGSFRSLFLFGTIGRFVFVLLKPKLSRIVLL